MDSRPDPIDRNVRKLRELRHWTQEELAVASGVDVRMAQRAESGRPLALESLKAIAAALTRRSKDSLRLRPTSGGPSCARSAARRRRKWQSLLRDRRYSFATSALACAYRSFVKRESTRRLEGDRDIEQGRCSTVRCRGSSSPMIVPPVALS
jgi:transcriptional regulator with XRE-family HTH domain